MMLDPVLSLQAHGEILKDTGLVTTASLNPDKS